MKKIFFQSSLPRSGSTLLQNIFGQNPDFYVTPTSGLIELLYSSRASYSNAIEFKAQNEQQMKDAFLSYCYHGMQGYFSGLTDKPYVLDKSRGWGSQYEFLNNFYPAPKIVCMVRDLRAIYSSMEKKFRANQHLDVGLVNNAQMVGTTTEKRIDVWSKGQPVGLAIERLQQTLKDGTAKNMHFVRFEDLCENPEMQINKIYNYLGVEPYSHDFDNIAQVTQEDDRVYGIFGDHKIKNKIIAPQEDWNEILGVNACNWIVENYRWFYNTFKYL